jgi:GT2 family glycosyltransferase
MIAFGCAITDLGLYERCAEPGIRLAAESDSAVLAFEGMDTLFQSYNLLLDKAAGYTDLEALVLVHQDAEIIDPEFCAKARRALADPDVAVVGCAGAVGVRSIAWWEGAVTWASFTHRYPELGGGEFPAFAWEPDQLPSHAQTGEVDSIDGFAMALSPWAVRELRFDESLGKLHGYDFDLCLQARSAGKKIHTEDFRVIHHHSLELISDPDLWVEAHIRLAEKWEGRLPSRGPDGGDWRRRALRAEAEASAAKGQARASELQYEALDRAVRKSWSWRLTAPLRVAGGSRLKRKIEERKRARGQARR